MITSKSNRCYMKGEEFKARQAWLPFEDAVGNTLQAIEDCKQAAWAWFKGWKRERYQGPKKEAQRPLKLTLWDMIGLQCRLALE